MPSCCVCADFGDIAALPRPLLGMSARKMRDYVEYTADFLLQGLGVSAYYKKKNPVRVQARSHLHTLNRA